MQTIEKIRCPKHGEIEHVLICKDCLAERFAEARMLVAKLKEVRERIYLLKAGGQIAWAEGERLVKTIGYTLERIRARGEE